MKAFFTIILTSICVYVFAQTSVYHPFPTENTKWIETENWIATNYCSDYHYNIEGDTVIDGFTYHKLHKIGVIYDECTDDIKWIISWYEGAFRNDSANKKVYYHNGEVDTLLYDFNISLGDTLPITYLNNGDENVVVDVDSVLVGENYHKRWETKYDGWLSLHLIEGVGSEFGLLTNYSDPPFEGGVTLMCLLKDDNMVWQIDPNWDCDIITNTPDIEALVPFVKIYPNPSSATINIESSWSMNRQPTILEIQDLFGRIYKTTRISISTQPVAINVSEYPSGIYIAIFRNTNGVLGRYKFLVTSN